MQCGAGAAPSASDSSLSRALPSAVVAARDSEAAPAGAVWMLVDVRSKSSTEVSLDMSKLPKGARPIALRYACEYLTRLWLRLK